MKVANANLNPGKEHKMYGKYFKTVTAVKLIKIVALALIAVYAIMAVTTPTFTLSTELKNADKTETVYEKSLTVGLSELNEFKKATKNVSEQYYPNAEESAAYLRTREFTEIERLGNLDTAIKKINDNIATTVEEWMVKTADENEEEFVAIAKAGGVITEYTNEGKPVINHETYKSYLCDVARSKIAKTVNMFDKELEARNVDGLRAFLFEAKEYAYTADIAKIDELKGKYLVENYTVDAEFCNKIKEISGVDAYIPNAGMSEEDIASYDRTNQISSVFGAASSLLTGNVYESTYVYYGYDLDTKSYVFEQNDMVKSCSVVQTVISIGSIVVFAVLALSAILTAIGFITRKYKKLKKMSIAYALIPISFAAFVNIAFDVNGIVATVKESVKKSHASSCTYDLGNIVMLGAVFSVIVLACAITTFILSGVYTSKYSKFVKQAAAETAAPVAETPVAEAKEAVVEETVVEETVVEEAVAEETAVEEAVAEETVEEETQEKNKEEN